MATLFDVPRKLVVVSINQDGLAVIASMWDSKWRTKPQANKNPGSLTTVVQTP